MNTWTQALSNVNTKVSWKVKESDKKYILQGFGDLADPDYNGGYKSGLHKPLEFDCLEQALWYLEKWAVDIYYDLDFGAQKDMKLDPEDDRVTITEVLSNGDEKVVWHFSGWHWDAKEFGLEQGKFLGHKKSVYSEAMEDY